jgi:hypothetical protein
MKKLKNTESHGRKKAPAKTSKAMKKLPVLAFPEPLFGKDRLRDDLRKWLLDWHKKHEASRYKSKDRNFTLCDRTLASMAPFLIEMLAPRTNGGAAAAEVLAERYRCWCGDAEAEWCYWINGDDVNDYRFPDDGGTVVVGGLPEFRKRKAA